MGTRTWFQSWKASDLTNFVDFLSLTNRQNLSAVQNADARQNQQHQQNWSTVQIDDSAVDPNQQNVSLKLEETTKCTAELLSTQQ